MLAAAFLPPTLRVLGFVAGIAGMLVMHAAVVLNWNLAVQLMLYTAGAIAFLRCVSVQCLLLWLNELQRLTRLALRAGTRATNGGQALQTTTCCTTWSPLPA